MGALLILFYLARVVYRVLLFVLGDPAAGVLSAQTIDEIARALISAVLWGVHILAIRADGRMGETAPAPQADVSAERANLAARIARLERELNEARQALQRLEAGPDDEKRPEAEPPPATGD